MYSRHGRPRHFLPGKWRCRRFLGGVNSRRNCTRNPIVAGRSTPLQGRIKLVSEPGLVRIACGICIGRVGFGSPRCSEGLLGRYGEHSTNQRPWAEATDGASRTRAVAVSGIHRRGREWPTPSYKKIRCRHHGPVLLIGAALPTAKPATDPPTSRPTYPRDREVPLACLVGELYVRVRYRGLRCVVGVSYLGVVSQVPCLG